MQKVIVKAPAKLNLALDVTGIAPNGYHMVDMVMQAIGLYETVEVIKSTGYSLRCPGSPVPTDEKNTATKAASVFFKEVGLLAGADIVIHKCVPTRAGMAGGSADAAAVLVALNILYNAKLSVSQLCTLGLSIGADVPFSIVGGTARATGIGEILTPLPPLPPCWFAIAMPSSGVSTPEAYSRFDALENPVHPNMEKVVSAIEQGNIANLARHMQNSLEQASGTAETAEIRKVLDAFGAMASMMTGSGAAVFGMYETQTQAEKAAAALASRVAETFVVPPVTNGPVILQTN